MKFSNELPPKEIYEQCVKQFGVSFYKGVIFTVDDTIYSENKLSDDLVEHESTHIKQQFKIGYKKWWDKYFKDEKFRYSQELEAYRNQYRYILTNEKSFKKKANKILNIVNSLSGKMYGNIKTVDEVKQDLK